MAKQALISGDSVTKMANTFRVPGDRLIIVGIDTDHRSVDEHWAFDPRISLPLDENKTRNIMVYGVQKPVKVEKVEGPNGPEYIVVDGRQRVRMWREAQRRLEKEGSPLLPGIPCVIDEGNTEDTLVSLNVSLNAVAVQDNLLARAENALRLKVRGASVESIAVDFGTTPNTIRNYLKIAKLPGDLKAAVQAGKVTVSAALELGKQDEEARKAILDKIPERNTPEDQAQADGDDGTDVEVDTTKKAEKHAPRKTVKVKKRNGPSARELKGEMTPKKFQKTVLEALEKAEKKVDPNFRMGVMFALQLKPLKELPKALKDVFAALDLEPSPPTPSE